MELALALTLALVLYWNWHWNQHWKCVGTTSATVLDTSRYMSGERNPYPFASLPLLFLPWTRVRTQVPAQVGARFTFGVALVGRVYQGLVLSMFGFGFGFGLFEGGKDSRSP